MDVIHRPKLHVNLFDIKKLFCLFVWLFLFLSETFCNTAIKGENRLICNKIADGIIAFVNTQACLLPQQSLRTLYYFQTDSFFLSLNGEAFEWNSRISVKSLARLSRCKLNEIREVNSRSISVLVCNMKSYDQRFRLTGRSQIIAKHNIIFWILLKSI